MTQPVLRTYRERFVQALADRFKVVALDIDRLVKNADPVHGDFTFPTFALAKTLRKAPLQVAADAAASLRVSGISITSVGPYINAKLDPLPFTREVIDAIRFAGSAYGSSKMGVGKTIVIDYSSPNIAKPIAFHHIRSTMIGHSLANLYRSQGYRVEGINYLGDWGKQFGLVAVGLEQFGDASRRTQMAHLVEVYVKANALAETDLAFDERARAFFKKMEQQDHEALALWEELRTISLREFQVIYQRLGIQFQHYEGESRYQNSMEQVIVEVQNSIGTKESEGAVIVDLPYADNESPILLKKSDGSTLYATRDLAAAVDRYDRFHFFKSLYVVATDQTLHFKQVFSVLEKMGKAWSSDCLHINFGRVHGMSTRKGQLVLLNDVLDEAKNRAKEKIEENQKLQRLHTEDVEKLAEQVGLGAIIFGDLKNRRSSDYTFNWDEVLSFEGRSGPYLQYAHARACNLLRRGGRQNGLPGDSGYDASLLQLPEEQHLIRRIAALPDALEAALGDHEPSYLADLLIDVATAFSQWYTMGNQDREKRILREEAADLTLARLHLVDAVRLTLAGGLALLGMPAPDSM